MSTRNTNPQNGILLKGVHLLLIPLILLSYLSGCSQPLPFMIHDLVTPISTSFTGSPPSNGAASSRTTPSSSTKALSSASTATVSPSPTITIGVKENELKGMIIHFWHPWSGSTKKAIDSLVEEFNLKNPWGILVTAVAFLGYDQLAKEIETNRQTSDFPQVVAALLHQALIWDQELPLVDQQTYIFDQNWGFKPEEKANFNQVFWDQDIISGRRLGIPAYQTGQILFYNQTWAKELGFQSPPATAEQLRQQACVAAQANLKDGNSDNDGTGGMIVSTDPGVILGWMEAFGGNPIVASFGTPTPIGKATKTSHPPAAQSVYQFDTPKTEEAITFLRKMYDEGCAWQSQSQTSEEPFARRHPLPGKGIRIARQ
jgi:ABC-type glycerol-3-phosphate transport system substrate-binding protein